MNEGRNDVRHPSRFSLRKTHWCLPSSRPICTTQHSDSDGNPILQLSGPFASPSPTSPALVRHLALSPLSLSYSLLAISKSFFIIYEKKKRETNKKDKANKKRSKYTMGL